jgi:hypothetical protein
MLLPANVSSPLISAEYRTSKLFFTCENDTKVPSPKKIRNKKNLEKENFILDFGLIHPKMVVCLVIDLCSKSFPF